MYNVGVRPSYATGFAQWPGASEYPQLWEGLVAGYAPFLGMTGGKLIDWSENGNTGILQANTHFIFDKFGTALDFDGTGDYVSVNDSPSLDISQDLTIFVRFKIDILPSSQGSSNTIIHKGDSFANNRNCYSIFIDDDTDKIMGFYSGDENWPADTVVSDNAIVAGTWYDVAFIKKGSVGYLYVNGLLQSDTQTGEGSTIATNAEGLKIGNRESESYTDGKISCVYLFNRGFSAEIALLYQLKRRLG